MARGRDRGRSREQEQKIQERLSSEIRLDGVGEDQVIKDLLKKIDNPSQYTNKQSMEIAIAVYEHITGEEMDGTRRSKLISRAVERDKAEEEHSRRGEEWVQEQIDNARRKLDITDEDKAEAMKNAEQMWQKGVAEAQSNKAKKRAKIKHRLETDPKEDLYVVPQREKIDMGGGRKTIKEKGATIRTAGFEFRLSPGMNKNVPKFVADKYRQMLRSKEQTREREKLLLADGDNDIGMETTELAREWNRIDMEQGGGGMAIPQMPEEDVFEYGEE